MPKFLRYFLILFLSLFAIVSLLETGFFFANRKWRPKVRTVHHPSLISPDPVVGWRGVPNATVGAHGGFGDNLFVYALYRTNEYGWRKTPVTAPEGRKKHLVFLGGSFTFGDWVDDEETLPAQTATHMPEYRPYNYGMPGYGPPNTLAVQLEDTMKDEVKEAEGICVYTVIPHDIARAAGSTSFYRYAQDAPYFKWTEEGGFERRGTLGENRSFLFAKIAGSQVLNFFDLDYPLSFRPIGAGMEMFYRYIVQSRAFYLSAFPKGKFVLLIYPVMNRYAPSIVTHFRDTGVDVLDYSYLLSDGWGPELLNPLDGHPSAVSYRKAAEQLAKDLRRTSPERVAAID